jgi:peptidyl-prolyl cis-trans isomerase A (cyclophilin A)
MRIMTRIGTFALAAVFIALACGAPKGDPKPQAAEATPTPTEPGEPAAAAQPSGPLASMPEDAPKAEEPAADPKKVTLRETHPGLTDPSRATETAPERYTALLATTKGDILIDVRRSWAPRGADRFYNLVKVGAFNDVAFFRVVEGFMAQFGIPGDPQVATAWRMARIEDDPVTHSNTRGTISFATSGRNSRVNQVFINLVDNGRLDRMGFAPFGVVRDMNVVDQLYAGYGEGAPAGRGPRQALIQREGNAYLKAQFPEMDYVRFAKIDQEFKVPREAPKRVSH